MNTQSKLNIEVKNNYSSNGLERIKSTAKFNIKNDKFSLHDDQKEFKKSLNRTSSHSWSRIGAKAHARSII